jgi:hypothetical protein
MKKFILLVACLISNISYSIDPSNIHYPGGAIAGEVQQFLNAQYLNMTPRQTFLISNLKTEFLDKLIAMDNNFSSSDKDKSKLLKKYEKKVNNLVFKASLEDMYGSMSGPGMGGYSMSGPAGMGMGGPGMSRCGLYGCPSMGTGHSETERQSAIKLDKSIYQLQRHNLNEKDSSTDSPSMAPPDSSVVPK